MPKRTQPNRGGGFTLVELLVVVGIIAILIGMLMPALHRVKRQSLSVKCKAQMRDIGIQLYLYSEANRGVLYPVGELEQVGADSSLWRWKTLGAEKEWKDLPDKGRSMRWPVYVFDPPVWNPPILICPEDVQPPGGPGEEHSYILNKHLAVNFDKAIRLGLSMNNRPSTEIILMGEKRTDLDDYYMEASEFDRIVEPYRHGLKLGSNYLFLDRHVDTVPPGEAKDSYDPWDPGGGGPVITPTGVAPGTGAGAGAGSGTTP